MSLKQNKHEFMVRNYSLKQKSNKKTKQNDKSLLALPQRQKIMEIEDKQEISAVRQLLSMKDQQRQDWINRTLENDSKVEKHSKGTCSKKNEQKSGIYIDTAQKYDGQPEIQQIQFNYKMENIFIKRQSFDRLNHSQRKIETKKHVSEQSKKKKQNNFNNNSFFMNRTNYWKNSNQMEKSDIFSLSKKIRSNITAQQLFHNDHQKTEPKKQTRASSYLDFQRSKSEFQKSKFDQNLQELQEIKIHSKSIIIFANKSMVVRQMLHKIQSKQQIDLSNLSMSENKPQNRRFRLQRQPFESDHTRKIQHKNFIPFKIEQQRKIQYSVRKLKQRIQRNPELNQHIHELDLKLLQKPTYCPWVERNKEKIRVKKNYPLTVRPLKLIN